MYPPSMILWEFLLPCCCGYKTTLFSDALELGYGAVVYTSVESDDKRVQYPITMRKFRVSSTKSVTIPLLELPAAVLAARLVSQATDELKVASNPTFWVDSTVV
ncbi:hypothetical protein PHET_11597 [Paragonimus heterotremus]|uniref:Uncharacterized protein n=1 Tax=Paragonimus heterotremus TaxID=100268 RepID=A0A8J4SZM2_9TREM|nr:hypothetical protein PHET_11597 [Paragonimus heterotremus]